MTGRELERLDTLAVRSWLGRAVHALERACTTINVLNVFPVPDSDTGTNMLSTLRSAAARADEDRARTVFGIADAAASGALSGVCGSSGVILAGYLRGFADGLTGLVDADGGPLAWALAVAADSAYAAVSDPLDGTILSVARAAALAAGQEDSGPVAAVINGAAVAARAALADTTGQVPALASADVVDAGGQGLVVLLDVLAEVAGTGVRPALPAAGTEATVRPHSVPTLTYAYEVQYLLEAPADAMPALRERLEEIGDSVAVVAGADRHNVHVHVDDVGAAIEAALDLGRPSRIRVTHFSDLISAGEG
jgi:uncharacterized protein